ncbi:hypothetical protein [Demequina flava]|uniref:hypothetical protein n=1 Tax=Demequina flava TaxID=1095025 RepID=UPI000780A968|nr:hypothetical protein [Demequina flava]
MTIFHNADDLIAAARAGAIDAVNTVGERTRATAIPMTPISQGGGDLRSSLTVVPARETEPDIESAVASDLPYAVRQHEELGYRHPNGGQAKFLELASLQVATHEGERIAGTIVRRHLER